MSGIYAENKVILVGKETTYGVDIVPTTPVLTRNYKQSPAMAQVIDRNLDMPSYGADPALITGLHVASSYEVEAAGAGAAGTAPGYKDVLLACGHAQTINAGVSVLYKPVSSGFDSLTEYAHKGGINHKKLGWRGALGMEFGRGAVPVFKVNGEGLYVAAVDVANPAASFAAFKEPQPVDKANTPTITLNGVVLELESLSFTFGQSFSYLNMPNFEAVSQKGRKATATLTALKKSVATFNPVALMQARTLVVLQIVHGVGAGYIVQVDAAKAQITGVDEGEIEGHESWILQLALTKTATGDDDYVITIK
ncbi:MAG: hypothetical protein ABL951_13115 [Alphaproteobacteria bacterium]